MLIRPGRRKSVRSNGRNPFMNKKCTVTSKLVTELTETNSKVKPACKNTIGRARTLSELFFYFVFCFCAVFLGNFKFYHLKYNFPVTYFASYLKFTRFEERTRKKIFRMIHLKALADMSSVLQVPLLIAHLIPYPLQNTALKVLQHSFFSLQGTSCH